MKRMLFLALAAAAWAGQAAAQDVAGLSLGGFYETRIDNKVSDEDLSFDYYGARMKLRDERWYEFFVDLGAQSAEWGDADADASGFFGMGGTLWLVRAEDLMVPLDIGLFASYHRGELEFDPGTGTTEDATYSKFVGQAVIRATGYGIVQPFIRAGVMKSDLDWDDAQSGDWDVVNAAINVGVQVTVSEQLTLSLEGNHSESSGFGVHADYWF